MADDSTVVADARPEEKPRNPRPPGAPTMSPSHYQHPGRLETGCVIANRFVIQKFLSKGGMGDVYEAEDLHLNQARVALKTIRPDYVWSPAMRDRFRQEVLLARSIAHPNVCPVYEMFSSFGAEGEIWFLTMKLLSGETLANRLHRLGPLAAPDAVRFAQEIASALDSAHTAGVIHRDLKPGNIFLESHISGVRAVVTDFGLARNWGEEPWSADAGATLVGTPAYIAPEILDGGIADPKTDLYSFGIILHEMIWGSRPADYDKEPHGSAEQRMHKVVIRCIYADPGLRYSSAGAAAEALIRAWNGGRRVFTRRELMLEGAVVLAAALTAGEWGIRGGEDVENLFSRVPRPRRVAILAAKNQTLPIEEASLMSGIVDSLSTNLARAETVERDLFVVPPNMVREQKLDDPSKAAGLFGANLVLQTSLTRKQDEIEIALQLMDCTSGKVIRKGSVTCAAASVYELPALATERAATLLDVRRPKGLASQIARGGTENPEAFLAYERGRESLRRASPSDVEQAITELEKAVEFDARFALAYAILAEAYVGNYRHLQEPAALEMAEENVRRCRSLAPNLARGYVSEAMVENERGNYGAAEAHLKKAIALDERDTLAPRILAKTYERTGKVTEAAKAYQALLAQHPNLWPVLMDWANLVADTGDLKHAEQLLRRATVAGSQAYLPWRDLGAIYIDLGQYAKAENALNRSIQLFPSGGAYYNLGVIFNWQNRYREGVKALEQAVHLYPNRAIIWDGLGDAYFLAGKQDKAADAWKTAATLASEAVSVNPKSRDGITRLALYQAKSGDHQHAAENLQRAQSLHSPNVEQLFIEARVNELNGHRKLALQQIAECVQRGFSKLEVIHAVGLAELRKDPAFQRMNLSHAVL